MSRRQGDVKALLTQARAQLREIEGTYQVSLIAKYISPGFKVKIKNLGENLRSVLDYLAHDIPETRCSPSKKKP